MKKSLQKGFTLIELLVVIAIIGILAGIVLTSLGTARDKAKDSRIVSDLAQVRVIAETMYSDSDGSYGTASTFCPGTVSSGVVTVGTCNGELAKLNSDAVKQGSAAGILIVTDSAVQNYAAYATMNGNNKTDVYCVDNTSLSKQYNKGSGWTAPTAASPKCP